MKLSTLCIYAYYEKNTDYIKNISFFLKYGLNNDSDFLIIINGTQTIDIPTRQNLTVIRRENKGYDFGAYADGLQHVNIDSYTHFVFLNSSVRGPFRYADIWQRHFTDMIKDDVKLVGTTINISTSAMPRLEAMGFTTPFPHVQTQMFALDQECLRFLMVHPSRVFKVNDDMDFWDIVQYKEVGMSQMVLRNGWNIDCLLHKYKGIDYRTIKADINVTSNEGDPSYAGKYFGSSYQANEVIFIKTDPLRSLPIPSSYIEHYQNTVCNLKTSLLGFTGVSILIIIALCLVKQYLIRTRN